MAKKEKVKSKDLSRRERIIKQPITNFIDTKYRDYAVYVLEARGIPNWQDGITPVSRYVLTNAPSTFQKTLTLVGSVISSGYHHGDCLEYSTKINLADGTQITIGEWTTKYPGAELLVKSIDENNEEVVGLAHSPRVGQTIDEYIEIEMENGEIFKCTPNHPFYVNGSWIEAKYLKEDDEIFNI